jgi:phospholipase D1/2
MASLLSDPAHCSRVALAKRWSMLVDAADYYKALAWAFKRAHTSIVIVGWDVGMNVELFRPTDSSPQDGYPPLVGDLLCALADERPDLRIHVLCWNRPFMDSVERESAQTPNSSWRKHERIHFCLDDQHPIGASHHQKLVIIDDAIAFSGGQDICHRRWDTQDHLAHDPRRFDPKGQAYPAFHDVQAMVQGPVAAALGEVARMRWDRSGDETSPKPLPVRTSGDSLIEWPTFVPVEMSDVPVGVSLTYPMHGGYPEQREVEALTVACLRSAQKRVYLENQFLTSKCVLAELRSLLARENAPEIVLVLPARAASWFEEGTMGAPQARFIRKLRRADRHGRLGVYYPAVPGPGDTRIIVHSKVMIIDDAFIKIASSNFNNRSMGLDTECDLSVEADGQAERTAAIAASRHRLLGEHLGLAPDEVARLEETQPLNTLIQSRASASRSLQVLKQRTPWKFRWLAYQTRLFDPDRPMARERVLSAFLSDSKRRKPRNPLWGALRILLACVGFAFLWSSYPILRAQEASAAMDWTLRAAAILGFFAVGGLCLVPATFLVVTALSFMGATSGFLKAWLGVILLSYIQYLLGALLPRERVNDLVLRRLDGLGQRLIRIRALPNFALRLLPVAPSSVLNLISGATHMNAPAFFLISAFGALMWVAPIAAFQALADFALREYGRTTAASLYLFFALALSLWLTLVPRARKTLRRPPRKSAS